MFEKFLGVIWPRPPVEGRHRYLVVGMLVTDEPIPEFEGKNQLILHGISAIVDGLAVVQRTETDRPLGDADSVLTDLDGLLAIAQEEA